MRAANKSKKVATARSRCKAANAAVTEEKKLRNMTTSALDFLLQYKNLSYILEALMKLGEWKIIGLNVYFFKY